MYDITRPGPPIKTIPTTPSRKSKEGQKGIISCIDFNPDGSGMYAAGSYSKTLGIYDERSDALCALIETVSGPTKVPNIFI